MSFVAEVKDAAERAEALHGVPAPALAAMALVESGYGWTRTARFANNSFGWKGIENSAATVSSFNNVIEQGKEVRCSEPDTYYNLQFRHGVTVLLEAERSVCVKGARSIDLQQADSDVDGVNSMLDIQAQRMY